MSTGEYSTRYVTQNTFELPDVSAISMSLSFNGYVDDFLYVYLNGTHIITIEGNPGSENFWDHWIPGRTYSGTSYFRTGQNVLTYYLRNNMNEGRLYLNSSIVTVTYKTK